MNAVEIHECAQMLYRAHGDKAEFEAAQNAQKLQKEGQETDARDWNRVRHAIAQMRGAPYS